MIHANTENHDFILLSKSWINLRDKHQIAEVSLNGYNVFMKCRLHKAGGGVLLYAKNYIKVVKISKTDVYAYDSLYVEVTEKNKKCVLGVIYRPPKQSEENDKKLYNEIKCVIKGKNEVICGDFNNPSVNWSTLSSNREGRRLIELAEEAFLYETVQRPTQGNNILDLVFTNDSDLIHTRKVGEPLVNSDHSIVRIKLNFQIKMKENSLLIPNYRKVNFVNIKRKLDSVNWNQLFDNTVPA